MGNLTARFAIVQYPDEEFSEIQEYDLPQDYFRFLFTEGLEPTNNHGEQEIRHTVIDRRIRQGTRGEAGQRYHERMWSSIATCRKRGRSFFEFLLESIQAHQAGQLALSLLHG
ncbi:MAG: hypothetical protein GXP27_15405 [Planctomycetes bacterium]|nr:hypothetical protein [Planctomycetota bacterium]